MSVLPSQESRTGLPTLSEISADFALLDDWEDRYRYLIELGRTLPPLPDALRTDAEQGARLRQPGVAGDEHRARQRLS